MKITDVRVYGVRSGNSGERGARFGESQYWGGGWQTQTLIANPMSLYPGFAAVRTRRMGPGQDPYAIEVFTDEGVTGAAVNYGGGPIAEFPWEGGDPASTVGEINRLYRQCRQSNAERR